MIVGSADGANSASTVREYPEVTAVDASLTADIALVGPAVELVERRDYLTASTVE